MKNSYPFSTAARWGRRLSGLLLLWLAFATGLRAQTTLGPGDLVFVGYNGSDDAGFTGNGQPIMPGSNVNDKFAFVLLKDVSASTRIFFTDYGWLTGGGFQPAWQAGPANNGSGTGSRGDGILSWTASASVAAGTQIVIRCKYNIGASTGTVASVETVSGQTYPLQLADASADQLFAYQATSARSMPTLLAGVMYGDGWSTSLTGTEFTPAKSTLPASLTTGVTAALNLPSTSTIFNTFALGIYNCSTTVGFPRTLRNAINARPNWKEYLGLDGTIGFLYNQDPDFLLQVPAAWDVPVACTFTVLQVIITAQPVSRTVCAYQPATFSIAAQNAQTYKWQSSPNGTTNWTDLANGAVYSGVTTTTLTVLNPTGLNGIYYRGVAMEPTEPTTVNSNAAQLTVNNPPQTLALTSSGPITCAMASVRLTASSTTAGTTYAFGGPSGPISTAPGTTTIATTQTGLYTVTATTAQSCTATTTRTVNEDKTPPASVSLAVSSPLNCTATSVTLTASASATSTLGYTFTGPGGPVTATGNQAVVTSAGTYTVTATASANGCSATATAVVTSNTTAPSATLANNGAISCAATSVTLTATTDMGTRFAFSTGATQIGGSGGNTATVTAGGGYSVVVTAPNGCTAAASTLVGSDVAPPSSVNLTGGTLTCAQTSLTLTATAIGGATYAFSGGTPLGTNQAVVTTAGTYSVVVTRANGCTASASTVITGDATAPTALNLTGGTLTCQQPSLTLTATSTGGVSYTFSGGTPLGTNQVVVTTAGSYSVIVAGTNGCTAVTSVSVASNQTSPPASLTSSGSLNCLVSSVTLTANAGTGLTYAFSTGASPLAPPNQAVVSTAGPYSVTVTAPNGCTASATTSVSLTPLPTPPTLVTQSGQAYPAGLSSLTIAQNVGNVVLTVSGCSGGTITWAGGMATTLSVSTASTGVQTFTATCTQNGCTSPLGVAMVTVVAPTLTVSHQDATFGQFGSNTIKPFLLLSNVGASPIPYGQITVRYWLTVEGTSPITNFQNYYVQIGPDNVRAQYVPLTQPRQGATAYVEYRFGGAAGSLSPMSNSGPIQNGFGKADYQGFNQADDYSYVLNRDYTLNPRITAYINGQLVYGQEPAVLGTEPVTPLTVSLLATATVFPTTDNTTLVATAQGGSGSYTYAFRGPVNLTPTGNTAVAAGLPAGVQTFTVTVTDTSLPTAQTATATVSVTVVATPVIPPLTVTLSATPTTLLTTGTTTLSATASGGIPGYLYSFSGPGTITSTGNTATVSGLTVGVQTFTVVVSDATAPTRQTRSATVSVTVINTPPTPTANTSQTATVGAGFTYTANPFTDLETPGGLTYTASISPANGLLFNAATRLISGTPSVTGVSTVTITATDPGSLTASTTFTITVNPAPVVVPTLLSVLQRDPDNGQLNTNTLKPYLQLRNQGTTAIPYSELTVRYWLTVENPVPLLFGLGSQLGGGNVQVRYVPISPVRVGASGYLEFSFTPGAGSLAGGGNSGEIQTSVNKQDYSGFFQGDDYSYVLNRDYAVNTRITAYRNNVLVFGTEPAMGTRLGVEEMALTVRVLGNPVVESGVSVSVQGAEGQPLRYELTDVTGHLVARQYVERAGAVDRQTLSVSRQPAGVLLLRVSTPTRSQTIKVLRQ